MRNVLLNNVLHIEWQYYHVILKQITIHFPRNEPSINSGITSHKFKWDKSIIIQTMLKINGIKIVVKISDLNWAERIYKELSVLMLNLQTWNYIKPLNKFKDPHVV